MQRDRAEDWPDMQSTTVTISGKGSNPKTTLYVGGLQESVNEAILHSAFIPFGALPAWDV